jgi:3-deoxy-D-manno-octulosonic-acid transferase
VALGFYMVMGIVLFPVAGLVVLIGCMFKPDWRNQVAERFGLAPRATGRPIVIWCASVGEVTTAQRLIRAVLAAGTAPVVLAVYTPTGLALAKELFGGQATVCLVPLDILPAVELWLERLRPRAANSPVCANTRSSFASVGARTNRARR